MGYKPLRPCRYPGCSTLVPSGYCDAHQPDGLDAESGLPHLYHLACNIAFLVALRRKQEIHRMIQPNTN